MQFQLWASVFGSNIFVLFCLLVALIKYIRPVFVSRSDQDSRKKTVEEIKRRAHSGGEWPQVNGRTLWIETLKTLSICTELIRAGCLKWQPNEINGQTRKAPVDAKRPVITLQESRSFPGSAGWSTHDNNFSKVILCRPCTLSRIQSSVHFDSMGNHSVLSFLSLQCRDLALLIFVVFSTSEFLFSLWCSDHDFSRGNVHQQILPHYL